MLSLPYIIAAIIGTSGVILLVVSFLDWLFSKRSAKLTSNTSSKDTQTASKEILNAHHTAEEIIKDAVTKGEEVMDGATLFKNSIVTDLNNNLRQVAESTLDAFKEQTRQFGKQYELMFKALQEEYKEKSSGTISQIEHVVTSELEDFRDILKRETMASQQIISQKIQDEFMSVQKEIVQYREGKYKEIDETVAKMAKQITQEVLGKSLTETDHQKLIINSLEKARDEGMFTT